VQIPQDPRIGTKSHDEAQVKAIVEAAVAAAIVVAGHEGPAGPVGPPLAFVAVWTPAQVLNYGSIEGIKIYNAAIAALTTKDSGNTADMHIFLKKVKERGQSFGWKTILNTPKNGGTRNVIEEHELIDLEDIRAHAMTYENDICKRERKGSSELFPDVFVLICIPIWRSKTHGYVGLWWLCNHDRRWDPTV
jgi:hypothetical protein